MDDLTRFERQLAANLHTYSDPAPFAMDPAQLAAIARARPRHRWSVGLRRGGLSGLSFERGWLAWAAVLGMLAVMLGGALLVSARLLQPSPVDEMPPRLVYVLSGDIYIAEGDGTDPVRIVDGPESGCGALFGGLSVSPGGRYVGYRSEWGDTCPGKVHILDVESGAVVTVEGAGWELAWSPDGKQIATWINHADSVGIYGVDGALVAELDGPTTSSGDWDPRWSPDGANAILVKSTSDTDPDRSVSTVWELPIDGTAPQSIDSHDPRAALASGGWASVAFAPDGRAAFGDPENLILVERDGSRRSVAEAGAGENIQGRVWWSPDGQRIAFIVQHGPATCEVSSFRPTNDIRVLDLATGVVTTAASAIEALTVAGEGFSPDGTRFLFVRHDCEAGQQPSLWSANTDGSHVRRLVDDVEGGAWLPTPRKDRAATPTSQPKSSPTASTSASSDGWIAFTVSERVGGGEEDDTDIWFVGLHREARRAVGSETDRVQELCPAFSPDGRSLAYGRVEGHGARHFVNADGTEGSQPAAYRQAALVVADVSDDGQVADRTAFEVGDGLPPPCPVWSPDGDQLAFGVNRTSPINPTATAAGSEVRIVNLADRDITVLPGLLATDLEWSPDGSQLAIASGADERVYGEASQDGRIRLYAPASGAIRSLDGTRGAIALTWSPDGRQIGYQRVGAPIAGGDGLVQLLVIEVETGQQEILDPGFGALHGIGPVWSPDGGTIAYQRTCRMTTPEPCGGEHHEVVLVNPAEPAGESPTPKGVIPATAATGQGPTMYLAPFRVTWSPDGESLLYLAWQTPPGPRDCSAGCPSSPLVLVAVPVDPTEAAVVLVESDELVAYDGYDDTTFVPIQTWGRAPAD